MKMKLFTLCMALFTTLYTFAQEEKVNNILSEPKVQVVESIETMSKGDNNSFTMTFTGISAKDLRNEWNKHLKTVCDKSKTAKDDEIYSANSTITGLPQTINIYSQVKELTKESAEVIAFFEIDYKMFKSENDPVNLAAINRFMDEFEVKITKFKYEEVLKEQGKLLSKIEKDARSLENEYDAMSKTIEKKLQEIDDLKKQQIINKEDQKNRQLDIVNQKNLIERMERAIRDLKN